ncbi:MAG TPA: Lpp/OprI family alanine-zipper lipoprotein [Dissulfurispiraceae bacterium]|nr:Lpp/OprI family alanine-zipper lipoprotein [Dissulfurispiraceae bacterium]
MKKTLLVVLMLAFALTLVGCATKGDLESVQSQQMMTKAKADQAAQDAQAAKATADAATLKAEAAAARAENAVKMAEERERIANEKAQMADEKAQKADAAFKGSMKK